MTQLSLRLREKEHHFSAAHIYYFSLLFQIKDLIMFSHAKQSFLKITAQRSHYLQITNLWFFSHIALHIVTKNAAQNLHNTILYTLLYLNQIKPAVILNTILNHVISHALYSVCKIKFLSADIFTGRCFFSFSFQQGFSSVNLRRQRSVFTWND